MDIDSGWSTGYNNFIFNTDKYPNATEMVGTVFLFSSLLGLTSYYNMVTLLNFGTRCNKV